MNKMILLAGTSALTGSLWLGQVTGQNTSTPHSRATPRAEAVATERTAPMGARASRRATPRASASPRELYLVQRQAPAAVEMWAAQREQGEQARVASTGSSAAGKDASDTFDLAAPATVEYLGRWQRETREAITRWGAVTGRRLTPRATLDLVVGGVLLELSAAEAAALRADPDVAAVTTLPTWRVAGDLAPSFLGADQLWYAYSFKPRGAGGVLGVIDSGITPSHPSFAEVAADGYQHRTPYAPAGLCATGAASCNAKLIGIYDFTTGGSEPDDGLDRTGHGTAVASAAVGNPIAYGGAWVQGTAPRGALISYKACEAGSCPGAAVLAAINQAVRDRVDVLNLSLGGASADPWTSPILAALQQADQAGVMVVAAAGNAGPGAGTLTSPGNAPWALTVAASTHSRAGAELYYDASRIDQLAASSGRGPARHGGVAKPDLAAPGVAILAAQGTGLGLWEGTSFAAPQVAGIALLMRGVRSNWSNAMIRSALVTSASNTLRLHDGLPATPFEGGAGRVRADAAMYQTLAFEDLSRPEWGVQSQREANPATGGNPEAVNRPSVQLSSCAGRCTAYRVVRETLGGGGWTARVQAPPGMRLEVSPASFVIDTGQRQPLQIHATATTVDGQFAPGWIHGQVIFERAGAADPVVMPISVNFTAPGEVAPTLRPLVLNDTVTVTLAPGESLTNAFYDTVNGPDLQITVATRATSSVRLMRVSATQDPDTSTPPTVVSTQALPADGGLVQMKWPGQKGGVRLFVEVSNTATQAQDVHISVSNQPERALH